MVARRLRARLHDGRAAVRRLGAAQRCGTTRALTLLLSTSRNKGDGVPLYDASAASYPRRRFLSTHTHAHTHTAHTSAHGPAVPYARARAAVGRPGRGKQTPSSFSFSSIPPNPMTAKDEEKKAHVSRSRPPPPHSSPSPCTGELSPAAAPPCAASRVACSPERALPDGMMAWQRGASLGRKSRHDAFLSPT